MNSSCKERHDPNFQVWDYVYKEGNKVKEYEGQKFHYLESGVDKVQVYYENGMICDSEEFKTTSLNLYKCLRCLKYL